VDLSFIYQVDKLSLKLIESLNLLYLQVLIFTSSLIYIIWVYEVFIKVVDYLLSCLKGISSIRLILSEQILLGITFSTVENVVYTSVLISIVISINLKFTHDLDLLIVID
jgi:hypothetical protein